ncbi:MoaD/ThiS family protein [Hirschia litorea]|uniref:MoaD/ThiS family protein n=1 Tax=Hirschia litorea TaxID=1199156 RepID=A0ABW2IHY1_9PROT
MTSILFYGKISDRFGDTLDVNLPQNSLSVGELRNFLSANYQFNEILDLTVRVTKNDEFVLETEMLQSSDVVSFLSPFSGG